MDKGFRRRTPATKLRPPSKSVRHLPRPRLSTELANIDSFRLALISAPAGSGKTTVLSEWYLALRERGVAAAWLSLDDFDNDPRRFLAHVISAIQAVRPGLGGEAFGFLTANPDVLMEDAATSLVHDFGGTNSRIVVFLDDYHEIRDRTIHAVVDFLIRCVPPNIQFVIGTRRDPRLSIERLRVRGEVLEIRWEDLRFNVDEARRYLKEVCGLRLSEDQVRALCHRTEGWITGLQLAAMTFAGAADTDRFVTGFTGSQRKIADYLLEGVFRRQSDTVRNFLMKTAILDRMTAPLCDMLTGRQDSRRLLETLENDNLFLFALDDHRAWYRYHHLFAEFLRNRLRTEHPDAMTGLHDRASEWCERNGYPAEAVRYAIAGNRFKRAARLLETAGRELFRQGDFKELRRWLDALPEGTVRRSPVLCTLHAWALGYLGEFDAARMRIACAEKAVARSAMAPDRESSTVTVGAELQVLRAVLGIIQSDEPDVSGLHPGIVSLFPRDEPLLRSYASITLGFASRMGGDLSLALRHFQEALEGSEGADSSLVNLNARLNIGIVNYLMGRAGIAEESFRNSLVVAGERRWLRSIGASFLRYGLALVLHEKNRTSEALEELSEAIAFLEAGDAFGFLGMALVERARTQLSLGRQDLAAADLAQARHVARGHNVLRVSFRADLLDARMAVLSKNRARAAEFLEAARTAFGGVKLIDRPVFSEKYEFFLIEPHRVFSEKYEFFLLEFLRLLIARGQFGEAVRMAGKALRSAGSAGRGRNVIEFLVLQAGAWNGLSRTDKALADLERALILAEGEGILRPFLDAGGEILPLLRQLRNKRRLRTAVAGILSALEDPGRSAGGNTAAGRTGGAFHHREVQILKLIAEGLRNREIGERLFLSEETIKWYLKRLYCKLYVRTRTEAIASARKLGLLAGSPDHFPPFGG
jgi:LuxR family maltose regulon positive regulatory protein